MGFVITTIHAFICVDPDDGDEGIPAINVPGMHDGMIAPLIAADEKRLASLEPIVERLVATGKLPPCKLVKFSVREDVKEYFVLGPTGDDAIIAVMSKPKRRPT